MPLVTQAEYARHRGTSREAVRQRTVTAGGPIPVHGVKKLLDVAEADDLWETTKTTAGASHVTGNGTAPAPMVTGSQLAQARTAALVVDVQTKRLALEPTPGRADLPRPCGAQSLRVRWFHPVRLIGSEQ
jgi:hypothetical protein